MRRRQLLLGSLAAAALGQPVEFRCPMDPEVRSPQPGKCPRCGMKLEAGLPDPREYRLELTTLPAAPRSGSTALLRFRVFDPDTGRPVTRFEEVHEKLFHLFVVSGDLAYFAHEHPVIAADGSFSLPVRFPRPGFYRLLADFFPAGGTPQLLPATVLVGPGPAEPIPPPAQNTAVSLRIEPAQPLAGQRNLLFFNFEPATGLRPWIGAWAHLLVASEDLLDMLHVHPQWEYRPEINPEIQFNVLFPRPGRYRLWLQFDRGGVVNTHSFPVTVRALG